MIIGIDPGQEGAWALLGGDRTEVHRLPYLLKRIDVERLLWPMPPASEVRLVVIETLGFRRQQSVQSAKTQSINWGMMLGALTYAGYVVSEVTPQEWQKAVLGKVETGQSKAAAIAFAERRFPDVNLMPGRCTTPQDGLADALCLAEYAKLRMAKLTKGSGQ